MIDEASTADIPQLGALFDAYRQFYGCSGDIDETLKFVAERLSTRTTQFFVSREQSRINAFMHLMPSFDTLALRPMWILEDLFVAPRGRRAGIGTALLIRAEQFALETSAARLTLSTAHANFAAQRVYERRGWKLDTEFRYYHRVLERPTTVVS